MKRRRKRMVFAQCEQCGCATEIATARTGMFHSPCPCCGCATARYVEAKA